MKKVFLIFGIAAFSSASAQKEVFDIEEYLKKKNAENSIQTPSIKSPFSDPHLFKNHQVEQLFTIPNNNPFTIPQAGSMPCLKPDMNLFTVMPNPGLGILSLYNGQEGRIPNVSDLPKTIITRK